MTKSIVTGDEESEERGEMSDRARRVRERPAPAVAALRPLRRSPTFWLIVIVNVALIALYFWSRGGAVTDVRVEAVGSDYRAFVDGKLVVEGKFDGASQGGIGFSMRETAKIPSLPNPRGVDSVRVSDFATGEVLFEDGFDGSPAALWQDGAPGWDVHNGVFATKTASVATTGPQPWGDYVLEAKLRNVTRATIYVRMSDDKNGVAFGLRPFRHYDTSLQLISDGQRVGGMTGARLELDRGQTIRSITAMLLRPYPVALLMIAGAIALAFLLRAPLLERWLQQVGQGFVEVAHLVVLSLALAALVLLWYLNYVVGDAIPHVPDSVAYIFQAKIFASFRLTADAPPVTESFSFFRPPFVHVVDDRWFSQYAFGHPLFLSIGQLFGVVWLVPPVLGAASLLLIYRLGVHTYGKGVGLLAAFLLFFSPFYEMTASNFMSHNTAAFVILMCLFLLVRPASGRQRLLGLFFSGVFLGLLFNMRPLVAVALIPVLGALMGYELLRERKDWRKLVREDVAFAAGALLLLMAYFLYNNATTGSFTESPQVLTLTNTENWIGFSGRHTVAAGLQNQQELLAFMLLVANGWPVLIGFSFAALPFLLGTRNRWDYFLGAGFLSLAAVNIFYTNAAVMHGPRFWYETMPFLMLLTARGAQCLRDAGATAAGWLMRRLGQEPRGGAWGVTGFAVFSLVAGLVALSTYGWMLEKRDAWAGIDFVPQKISLLEDFNGINPRLLDRAEEMDLENALVLMEPCGGPWRCYGSVFWKNSPGLDGDVVWAKRLKTQDDIALIQQFSGRSLYLADYGQGTIRPVTMLEIAGGIEATPTPAAPATPGAPATPATPTAGAAERDEQRRRDLDVIRQALADYAAQAGGYPNTRGQVQTLCVFRDLDEGCALSDVLSPLPKDPLNNTGSSGYWYASDGSTFVVAARQEQLPVDEGVCPELQHIARFAPLYCVTGP